MLFKDRSQAGKQLAKALLGYKGQPCVVLALPRGGVVLGLEVAKALNVPLDLVIPRKIGHPLNPEYAIGAITEDGAAIWNQAELGRLDEHWIIQQTKSEVNEARRRRQTYLAGRLPIRLQNKTVIIVDDGVATGLTMLAAIQQVLPQQPAKIIVAIPIVPADTAKKLQPPADELIALDISLIYKGAVGAYYQNFQQVEDSEVIDLLKS
jgi:putative phosphoribosyl transferase